MFWRIPAPLAGVSDDFPVGVRGIKDLLPARALLGQDILPAERLRRVRLDHNRVTVKAPYATGKPGCAGKIRRRADAIAFRHRTLKLFPVKTLRSGCCRNEC